MVADNRKNEHDREAAKLCFEFFKHFTTLTTAVALVGLALVQRFELRLDTAGVGIVVLGITLLLSIWGMLSVAIPAVINDELPKMGVTTYIIMAFTAALFLFGVVMFAVSTAPPPSTSDCPFEPFC